MSQLLALCFDVGASPSIWLRREDDTLANAGMGWGLAWYPGDSHAAAVVRDPRPIAGNTRLLSAWERFRSTAFICHIRGAAMRPTEQDTHPFVRAYAGRDFTFAHNGQIDPFSARKLSLGDDPVFEPVGTTDSERVFCWLLTRMREKKARSLADFGYAELLEAFRSVNASGTLNVLMSDGHDIVAYSDVKGTRGLHFCRRVPPHETTTIENKAVRVEHGEHLDERRTAVFVATSPMGPGWSSIGDGQMIAVRRGAIVFDSAEGRAPAVAPIRAIDDASGNHASQREKDESRPGMASVQDQKAASAPTVFRTRAGDAAARRMQVTHTTAYRYQNAVEHSSHLLRLHPMHAIEHRVIEHSVELSVDCEVHEFEDAFGNRSSRVMILQPYDELEVTARSIIELLPLRRPTPSARTTLPLVFMPWQRQMMTPYLLPPELPETQLAELSTFASSFAARQDDDVLETLRDINQTIHRDFAYVQGLTSNETTPYDVYSTRKGVCQDFANLFICLSRLLGVPARYRVGYIHTGANYDNQLQSEASHAWAEVYLPWTGWRGFDPTNGCLAGLDHICVAAGRNYRDATPTSGTIFKGGGGTETLSVSVKVEVLEDSTVEDAAAKKA